MKLDHNGIMKSDLLSDALPEGTSLIRPVDRSISLIAGVSFLVCFIIFIYEFCCGESVYDWIPVMGVPFVISGLILYLTLRNWILLTIAVASVVIAFFLWDTAFAVFYLLVFITMGIAGVVCLVEILQRIIFYKVIHIIEFSNVKKKLSVLDSVVTFIFSVPKDLDTRNIKLNDKTVRPNIPWNEMGSSIVLGIVICAFIWIYLSMNPGLYNDVFNEDVPAFLFTLSMYIPVIILPLMIFKSLNARIETNYRDFRIYDGAVATIERMAIPIFVIFIITLVVINDVNFEDVAYCIFLCTVMTIAMIVAVAFVYYAMFESKIINDVRTKWPLFRPVSVFVGLDKSKGYGTFDDVPGTPIRSKDDFGSLESQDDNSV